MIIKYIKSIFRRHARLNALKKIRKGDHLYVYKAGGTYSHHGLYVGDGNVVHYAGFAKKFSRAPIEIVTLEEFAGGCTIYLKKYNQRRFERDSVVDRAISRVGENCYSIFNNNCEHFVFWCITGKHKSKQVNRSIISINTNLALFVLNSSIGEITSNLTAAELFYTNLGTAFFMVFSLGVSMHLAITIMNHTFLQYKSKLSSLEAKARYIGRNTGTICGFIITCIIIFLLQYLGNEKGLSDNSLYSGLQYIGELFFCDYEVGFMICVLVPFLSIFFSGAITYHLIKKLNKSNPIYDKAIATPRAKIFTRRLSTMIIPFLILVFIVQGVIFIS